MRVHVQQGRRAAFSLIEIMLVLGIMTLISYNLVTVLTSSTKAYQSDSVAVNLENLGRRAVDRIAMELVGSSRDSLYITPASPFNTSELNYEETVGFEDGEIIWSDPQQIAFAIVDDQVIWIEKLGTPEERSVVWCKHVANYLEGEEFNAIDDNGNGLVDERGLSFDLEGDSVLIRLTLEDTDSNGRRIVRTTEARVTCRN